MKFLTRISTFLAIIVLALGSVFFTAGCSGDSAETIYRNVALIVTGFYVPVEGNETIVAGNTGAPVTAMNLRQSGDQLESVDNNGSIFRGTIGRVGDDLASFTLNGQTTAGQDVTISGTIGVAVGSTEASMRATWIEPTVVGAVAAVASVPINNPVSTNDTDNGSGGSDGDALTITASGSSTIDITTSDLTRNFTASGGDGNYSWSLSNSSLGGISGSGNSVTYIANQVEGSQTVRVTDGASASDAATVTQQ